MTVPVNKLFTFTNMLLSRRKLYYLYSVVNLIISLLLNISSTFLNLAHSATELASNVYDSCTYVPKSKICVDDTPCKTDSSGVLVCLSGVVLESGGAPTVMSPLGSLSVLQSCWKYSFQYACNPLIDPNEVQKILPLGVNNGCILEQSNSACNLVNSFCSSEITNELIPAQQKRCAQYQQTYSCETTSQSGSVSSSTSTLCSPPAIQSDTLSLGIDTIGKLITPSSTTKSSSFSQAAIAMEIASEMQSYSGCTASNPQNCISSLLFGGVRESCTKGWLGLRNCCTAKPGAKSNSTMVGLILGPLASVVKYAGEVSVDSASPYVFDAMYSSGAYTQGMNSSIIQSASVITDSEGFAQTSIFASNGINFGAYGFTWGLGSAPAVNGLFGASTQLDLISSETQGYYVSFNPYVFAGSLAVSAIETLGNCTEDENLLAIHRGEELSVYVTENCIEKQSITNNCLVYQDNYCSFNGVLGKIINQQGKAQLGIDFSSCEGLTKSQISALDFSKINFSEFTGKLIQQAQSNTPKNLSSNYLSIESKLIQGNKQSSINGLGYPLKKNNLNTK